MTDEAPETQDQPAVEAPDTGTSQFEAPFNINDVDESYRGDVERYVKQTQGAFTKKTQELATERQQYQQAVDFVTRLQSDPEFQAQQFRQLGGALGYEIQDPAPVEFADPVEELRAELAELKAWKNQTAQQTEEQQLVAQLDQHVESELDRLGVKGDAQRDFVVRQAVTMPPRPDGTLNVEHALQAIQQDLYAEWQADYIRSKKAPRVVPGVQGQKAPNHTNAEDRTARLAAIVAAEMQE